MNHSLETVSALADSLSKQVMSEAMQELRVEQQQQLMMQHIAAENSMAQVAELPIAQILSLYDLDNDLDLDTVCSLLREITAVDGWNECSLSSRSRLFVDLLHISVLRAYKLYQMDKSPQLLQHSQQQLQALQQEMRQQLVGDELSPSNLMLSQQLRCQHLIADKYNRVSDHPAVVLQIGDTDGVVQLSAMYWHYFSQHIGDCRQPDTARGFMMASYQPLMARLGVRKEIIEFDSQLFPKLNTHDKLEYAAILTHWLCDVEHILLRMANIYKVIPHSELSRQIYDKILSYMRVFPNVLPRLAIRIICQGMAAVESMCREKEVLGRDLERMVMRPDFIPRCSEVIASIVEQLRGNADRAEMFMICPYMLAYDYIRAAVDPESRVHVDDEVQNHAIRIYCRFMFEFPYYNSKCYDVFNTFACRKQFSSIIMDMSSMQGKAEQFAMLFGKILALNTEQNEYRYDCVILSFLEVISKKDDYFRHYSKTLGESRYSSPEVAESVWHQLQRTPYILCYQLQRLFALCITDDDEDWAIEYKIPLFIDMNLRFLASIIHLADRDYAETVLEEYRSFLTFAMAELQPGRGLTGSALFASPKYKALYCFLFSSFLQHDSASKRVSMKEILQFYPDKKLRAVIKESMICLLEYIFAALTEQRKGEAVVIRAMLDAPNVGDISRTLANSADRKSLARVAARALTVKAIESSSRSSSRRRRNMKIADGISISRSEMNKYKETGYISPELIKAYARIFTQVRARRPEAVYDALWRIRIAMKGKGAGSNFPFTVCAYVQHAFTTKFVSADAVAAQNASVQIAMNGVLASQQPPAAAVKKKRRKRKKKKKSKRGSRSSNSGTTAATVATTSTVSALVAVSTVASAARSAEAIVTSSAAPS